VTVAGLLLRADRLLESGEQSTVCADRSRRRRRSCLADALAGVPVSNNHVELPRLAVAGSRRSRSRTAPSLSARVPWRAEGSGRLACCGGPGSRQHHAVQQVVGGQS